MAGGGVLNAIEGTVLLVILSGLFAIPPGVLAAFFAAYYPNAPLGIAVRFSTDVLSGVPSIIIGLFLYTVVVKVQGHFSALAGGIALAILMLPVIIRTTEEMLKLVPPVAARRLAGAGSAGMEDFAASSAAGSDERTHHGVPARAGPRVRRNGAAPLHRPGQR